MSSQGNGQRGGYKVQMIGQAKADLKQRNEEAIQAGKGDEFLAALRVIGKRLRTDPLDFGEPQYRFSGLKLLVRLAVVALLVVEFAVHEEQRLVFIRRFEVLG